MEDTITRSGPFYGCEGDFVVTPWVGEPFNALAALSVAGFALFGLRHCAPQGHELRTRATYLAFALLGAGAVVFHVTLLEWAEPLHGLPTVYAACVLLFSALTSQREPIITNESNPQLALCLAFYAALPTSTILLELSHDAILPIFAALTIGVLALQSWRIFSEHRLSLDESGVTALARASLGLFLVAFLCWLVESQYCARIGVWNFHALWHVLEGVAGYLFCIFLSACRAISQDWDVNIHYWHSLLPVITIDKDPVAFSMEF